MSGSRRRKARAGSGEPRPREGHTLTIAPFLWFDGNAEEAARFYVSLFPDSRLEGVIAAPGDNPETRAGEPLTVEFTLAGRRYMGLNGGPRVPFTEAFSLVVGCADQAVVLIQPGAARTSQGEATDAAVGADGAFDPRHPTTSDAMAAIAMPPGPRWCVLIPDPSCEAGGPRQGPRCPIPATHAGVKAAPPRQSP
jgi:hypothetical protein